MSKIVVLVALCLGSASCSSTVSASCNFTTQNYCVTISVSSGLTLTSPTCTGGTLIDACPMTGVVGRCVVQTMVSVPGATGTQTTTSVYYTGADLTAGQAACTSSSGTWTTS